LGERVGVRGLRHVKTNMGPFISPTDPSSHLSCFSKSIHDPPKAEKKERCHVEDPSLHGCGTDMRKRKIDLSAR
jgi:hypothetical protein